MKVKIETGVALPPTYASVEKLVPWEKIKIGQSFVLTEEVFGQQPIQRVRVFLIKHHAATKRRFTVRKLRNETLYRCWRVK